MAEEIERETRYYRSFSDDFVETANQGYELPEDFEWIDDSRAGRAKAAVLRPIGLLVAKVYSKAALGMRIENREAILDYQNSCDEGFFVYINHTQTFNDVVLPLLMAYPKRAYILISPSNMGIPVLGGLLPAFGALPIPDNLEQTKKLNAAVKTRIEEGQAVITYPEGHLWPWNTHPRPLEAAAFTYPVSTNRPVFAATTTYQPRAHHKTPRATVYVDGPFYPDESLPRARRKEKLRDEVQAAMQKRSRESTVEYVRYRPAEGAPALPGVEDEPAAPASESARAATPQDAADQVARCYATREPQAREAASAAAAQVSQAAQAVTRSPAIQGGDAR